MASDPENDPNVEAAEDEAARIGAYDLDGDGKISPIEDARAQLGVIDAELEQAAEEGGIKGKIAEAAHHIVDKFDND
jgi:hypothetical protein